MTRDQFIAHYLDELTGHLHSSMNLVHAVDGNRPLLADAEWAKLGRFMRGRINVARDMLGRMHDSIKPVLPPGPTKEVPKQELPKPGFVPQPNGVLPR